MTDDYDGPGLDTEIAIIEVGGTVGDIESQPYLEAIRQFRAEIGYGNSMLIHVTLVPYLACSRELKTKPTQASVKDLQGLGIQPDVIVCRMEHPMTESIRNKIALFCNVPKENVIENEDLDVLYEVPMALEEEHLAQVACKCLQIPCPDPDLADWKQMLYDWKHPEKEVTVALVGKYVELHDAYLSVVEALSAAGAYNHVKVNIDWVDSEDISGYNAAERLKNCGGVLVPGGFGTRGLAGKIAAVKYARENNVPFLGICLGMQMAIVEFARDVLGYADANTVEVDPDTEHPVIHLMPDQEGVTDIGGTLRLGSYPCVLTPGTKVAELYGTAKTTERHRHRYEVNNAYRDELQANGMKLAGMSPDGRIVEMIELENHPFFCATQAHPEFKSRPNRPHPLFRGFVGAIASRTK